VGAVLTDDPAEEQAQKRLKSLLNKITKDNFAKITGQIVDVINERKLAKTLSGFINQIFDKALTETHFAELYADLVASLNPALPSLKDEEGNDVQFRRTLLNKCQEEFEAGATAMKAVSEREKHAKESGEAPPEDGQEDDEDKEEEEKEEEKKDEEELGEVDEAKAKHDAGGLGCMGWWKTTRHHPRSQAPSCHGAPRADCVHRRVLLPQRWPPRRLSWRRARRSGARRRRSCRRASACWATSFSWASCSSELRAGVGELCCRQSDGSCPPPSVSRLLSPAWWCENPC
jgi:hypothetical protein